MQPGLCLPQKPPACDDDVAWFQTCRRRPMICSAVIRHRHGEDLRVAGRYDDGCREPVEKQMREFSTVHRSQAKSQGPHKNTRGCPRVFLCFDVAFRQTPVDVNGCFSVSTLLFGHTKVDATRTVFSSEAARMR